MQPLDDAALLREYVENRSDEAFAALVTKYINLVYSVAMRCVGNPHQAEEITQAVFIILARKAPQLRHQRALSSWLFQTTRLTANNSIRTEIRRQRREQEAYMQSTANEPNDQAWCQIAPLLDAAVEALGEKERRAVLLRFYEGRNLRDVGLALGASEAAAEKRVSRAVDKLRRFFARRGVTVSVGAIAVAVSANSAQAAPVGLAKTISAIAAANGATASASTLTLIKGALKVMAWTKTQAAVTAGIVAISVVAPFLLEHQAQGKLRGLDDWLQAQRAQIKSLRVDNETLSRIAANVSLTQKQAADLEKLRGEVDALQVRANPAAKLQEEKHRLDNSLNPRTDMQIKEQAIAKITYGKNWVIAFYQFAQKNQGQFPTNFDQAAEFLSDEGKKETKVTTDQFDIVFTGSPSAISNAKDIIALREKEAWPTARGQWAKAYAFADGHCEIHSEPQNDFSTYENAHMMSQLRESIAGQRCNYEQIFHRHRRYRGCGRSVSSLLLRIQRQTAAAVQERASSAAQQSETLAEVSAENQRLSQILEKLEKHA